MVTLSVIRERPPNGPLTQGGQEMISMSQFLAVRALLEESVPKKEVARRLGVDVRTVRYWAKKIQKEGATCRERRVGSSKLDRHRDLIAGKVKQGLNATQIYGDLVKRKDFDASYVIVRRLVRELKQREPEVYCRMHYEPGEEMQIDFGDVGLFLSEGACLHPGTAPTTRRWLSCAAPVVVAGGTYRRASSAPGPDGGVQR